MTGIDEIIIADQHLIVLCISILFTILTIFRRTVLLDLLATVCWFISGATHLLASPTTTPFYSISFLYWGLGLIFLVLTFADIFQNFNIRESSKGVGPL